MEFDPYVPIQPKQGVTSTFSPYGAGALPGIPQPTENWGKILGSFSESLQRAFAAQEPERREEQEAEAARIVLEQESEELSKMLHEAAKKGEIPAGYSPYMVKQLNRQLARKAAREVEEWSTKNENWFNDPDYRAQDADGNLLSVEESTPTAVLERYKNQYLGEKYPGLLGTAEGVQIFQPLYDDAKRKYVEKTNDLLTKAQLKKLGAGFSDDMTELFERFMVDPDAPNAARRMGDFVQVLFQEMRQSYSGLGYSLPDGSLNEAALKPMIQALETDLTAVTDQEGVGLIEDAIAVLRQINPKGKNEKDSWGFMFKAELDELDAKAAKRKQALLDRGLTLGDESTREGSRLADLVMGQSAVFEEIDRYAAGDADPRASQVSQFLRNLIVDKYPDASSGAVDVAVGKLVGRVYDRINDARSEPSNPRGVAQVNYNNRASRLQDIRDPQERKEAAQRLREEGEADGLNTDRANRVIEEVTQRENSQFNISRQYRSTANGSTALQSYGRQLENFAVARAQELANDVTLTYSDVRRDPRFQELESFVDANVKAVESQVTRSANAAASRVVGSASETALADEEALFLEEVNTYLEGQLEVIPNRLDIFIPSTVEQVRKDQMLSTPQAMTGAEIDVADAGFLIGGGYMDASEASTDYARSLAAGTNFWTEFMRADTWDQWNNMHTSELQNLKKAATATDADSSYRGAGIDANKKPLAGQYTDWATNDVSQTNLNQKFEAFSLIEAMRGWELPRQLARIPGSADKIFDKRTGLAVPEEFLNWELFPVLGPDMWADSAYPTVNQNSEAALANKAFMQEYRETFYPDGMDKPRRSSGSLSEEEWVKYENAVAAWEVSPSGKVYATLPDRLQLGPMRFLDAQVKLWKDWQDYKLTQ